MAVRARGRRDAGSLHTSPDPAQIGPLLREAGFLGSEDDPVSCRATFDASGKPKRVSARYADGWSCAMRLHRDGSFSLVQSFSIRVPRVKP